MVGCWVAVVCPQHHAAEGMQMSVGTVSPSLREYRCVHICRRLPSELNLGSLRNGLFTYCAEEVESLLNLVDLRGGSQIRILPTAAYTAILNLVPVRVLPIGGIVSDLFY
jgi:hypothetical protein